MERSDSPQTSSDIERETLLPADAADVWESLSDPARLSEWFGADVEGRVERGEVLTFTLHDGTQRRAVVEFAEPGQRLVFRYLPFERTPDGRSRRSESSRVAIHLEPLSPHIVSDGDDVRKTLKVGAQTVIRITETRVGSAGTPRPQIGFHARA